VWRAIDTETLLEGDVGNHTNNDDIVISNLQKSMGSSVLRIGLLPQWLFIGRKAHAVDISALGIIPPKKSYIPHSARSNQLLNNFIILTA
jgi:hypothetical protein